MDELENDDGLGADMALTTTRRSRPGIVLAGGEGMGALLPVVEKELLHYRILSAMQDGGFFGSYRCSKEARACVCATGPPVTARTSTSPAAPGFGVDDPSGAWRLHASGPPSAAWAR